MAPPVAAALLLLLAPPCAPFTPPSGLTGAMPMLRLHLSVHDSVKLLPPILAEGTDAWPSVEATCRRRRTADGHEAGRQQPRPAPRPNSAGEGRLLSPHGWWSTLGYLSPPTDSSPPPPLPLSLPPSLPLPLHARRATPPRMAAPTEAYFLAGGLCAALSHALATPIDVVKTRQQTRAAYARLSLAQGLRRVAADEGAAALLTGALPTLLGYGAEGALKFGAYESLKPPAAALLGGEARGAAAAALLAGALAAVALAPAEATRIRMVGDEAYAGLGAAAAAAKLCADEGGGALLRGVPATCSKQLPYTAAKQLAFDALDGRLPLVVAAAAAALLAALASQPGDAILSRVSQRGGEGQSVCEVAAELGVAGLARGLRARLVHVGVIVTVQLVLYDSLKHAFGVP